MGSLPPPLTWALTGGSKSVSHFGIPVMAPFTLEGNELHGLAAPVENLTRFC